MKRLSWQNVMGSTGLVALIACGQVKPSSDAAGDADENSGEALAESVTIEGKAKWELKPVDVLVIRENSNRLQTQPLASQLYADNQETPLAYRNLAVRLYNTGVDFQMGVVDAVNSTAANFGALLADADGKNHIMKADSFEFIEMAVDRLIHRNINGNVSQYQPLRALREAVTRNDGGNEGFIRKKAMLAILAVSYMDESGESFDTDATAEFLDELKGAGNWVLWNLGTPKQGCSFQNAAVQTVYTNADSSAANVPDPDAEGAMDLINDYQRRAKLDRLTSLSGGKSESICKTSYIDFMSRFAGEAVKPAFFVFKLEKEPNPATIQVTVKNKPVENWKYRTATKELLLPTSIPSGTGFRVTYMTPGKTGKTITGKSASDGELGEIGASSISEIELAWLTEINGISPQRAYQDNCVGCHGRYSNYDGFDSFKAQDLARIADADKSATGMGMPRGGVTNFNTTPAGQAMIEWLSNY